MTVETRTFGFNLIGHVSGNLGLSVAARNVARAIVERGMPLAVLDIEDGAKRGGQDHPFAAYEVTELSALPYAVNLFVVSVYTMRRLFDAHRSLRERPDTLQVALCFWELPTLPPRWLPPLDAMDVIVATSDFMRYAFQFSVSGPAVIRGRLPVHLPDGVAADRQRFGIPSGAVAFVTSFEPYSDPARKNVFGTIAAFRRGTAGVPEARLVINVNNATKEDGTIHPIVESLRDACADDDRIRVATTPLSYVEVLSLYASCDVYLSLHRAEGLGLGMAESMTLGKPVVATGWSGNLTFMDHRNACLVGYRLVPVQGMTHIYSHDQLEDTTPWADPDINEAAAWIRRLLADAPLRSAIGAAAQRSIAEYNDDADRATFLDEIRAIRDDRLRLGAGRVQRTRDPLSQSTRAGRLARIQELERELEWIKGRPAYRLASAAKGLLRRRRTDDASPQ